MIPLRLDNGKTRLQRRHQLAWCLIAPLAWLSALGPCCSVSAEPKPASDRPNFVFILSDDQDWTGLSVQMHDAMPNSKSDFYRTPNLERLAAQGMRFTDAYAPAPVCSPTRYSLQTGKSPAQLHWTKASGVMTAADGYKLVPPRIIRQIASEETTLGEILQRAGYGTAHYGKWHLSGGGPGRHGYDEHDGDTSNSDAAPFTDPNPVDIFGISKRAGEFMEKHLRLKKPFFVQLSHHALHYPQNALKATLEFYQNRPPGRIHRDVQRAAITENLDTGVGMIMKKIDELDIADNTYLIYMSDNGGGGGGGGKGARPVQGGKGSLWEGGIRVPLIIRGPSVKPDSFCHVPVVGFDLFPTLCELAGVTEALPKGVEGGSFASLLQNAGKGMVKRPREELVFHFPHYQSGDGPHSAIRLGNDKLIRFYESDTTQLFDLSSDLIEQRDLSQQMPHKAADLSSRLDQYLATVNAQMPVRNLSYDPSSPPQSKRERKQGGRKRSKTQSDQPNRRKQTGGRVGGQRPDPIVYALDADGDGVLSAAEIENVVSVLKRFDKNGDGKVTRDEVRSDDAGTRQRNERPSNQ